MGVMELESSGGSGRWGPPSLPASLLKNTKDFHKNNLKHLKKLSLRNRENAAAAAAAAAAANSDADPASADVVAGPIKASHTIQTAKKYDHVQSRVSAWKKTAGGDHTSSPTKAGKSNYLKGND